MNNNVYDLERDHDMFTRQVNEKIDMMCKEIMLIRNGYGYRIDIDENYSFIYKTNSSSYKFIRYSFIQHLFYVSDDRINDYHEWFPELLKLYNTAVSVKESLLKERVQKLSELSEIINNCIK